MPTNAKDGPCLLSEFLYEYGIRGTVCNASIWSNVLIAKEQRRIELECV